MKAEDLAWMDPTRLELLADELGIGPERLRAILRSKIAAKLLELSTHPSPSD